MRLQILLFALAANTLPAAETNAVDVIALGRISTDGSTGVSNDGWTVSGVNNYSESYKSALRFNAKDDFVQSPAFARPVTRILLETVSSTNAHRRLAFTPLRGDVAQTNLTRLCAYSPTKNIFRAQTLSWPRSAGVRAFRIQLEGAGSTNWGIRTMTLVSDDPAPGTVVSLR